MIIIVEGPKRSGKTTFCNMLKEFVKCPVIYVNERLPLTFDYTDKKSVCLGSIYSMMDMAFETENEIKEKIGVEPIILFDRFHISEIVYGGYVRGYDISRMWDIDETLAMHGVIGVFITSDTIKKRYDEYAYEKEFNKACNDSMIPFIKFNFDDTKGVPQIDKILKVVFRK